MNNFNIIINNYFDLFKLFKLSIYTLLKLLYINLNYKCINNSLEFYNFKRFYLIKHISERLLKLNPNYLKIIQSICLQKDFLTKEEQNYLIKYTNNVPFKNSDVNFDLINFLKYNNVIFENNEPINSGVTALVYKGKYKNKDIAIKVLKNNAEINMFDCLNTIQLLINCISFLPFIKDFNLQSIFILNKKIMLEQLDFIIEKNNLLKFSESCQNYDYIKIPKIYIIENDISNNYQKNNFSDLKFNNKFLLLEYIYGFDIKTLIEFNNKNLNKIFGEKILKFGLISILMTSCIHCDLHAGNFILNVKDLNNNKILNNNEIINIFSDKNENINNENINYNNYEFILNIIDFGLAIFPSKDTQHTYYEYFDKIFIKQDYINGSEYTLINLIENFDGKKTLYSKNFNYAKNDLYNLFKSYNAKDYDLEIFYKINKIINKYEFKFKDEMLKIQISLAISYNMTKNLLGENGINAVTKKLMTELYKFNQIINFD